MENINTTIRYAMADLLSDYDYEYNYSALDKIISTWAENKSTLIKALSTHPNWIPEQLCVAFDTNYERTTNPKISEMFSEFLIDCAGRYCDNIPDAIKARKELACMWLPQPVYDYLSCLPLHATRTISDDVYALLNEWIPEIHPHKGEKTSRVINRICTYLGYNKHPDYNRKFAIYADSLSPMIIKRHTVISVNPLDYLTMSFGNSWASCHTIDKENKRNMPDNYSGCYSSGTISYMLDSVSFIFYTVDASYDGTEYWTQPKINRQMFHFGEDKLVQGRLYPQDNDNNVDEYTMYRQIVQQIIAQCFNMPNLWTVSKGTEHASRYILSRGTHYRDYQNYSNCTLSRNKEHPNENNFIVGASPICIECGFTHSISDNINHCHENNTNFCEDCGCEIDEDDTYYINGETYCRDCVHYCERCGEYHRMEEYYIGSEDRYVCESCFDNYYAPCDYCGDNDDVDDMTEAIDQYGDIVYVCQDCLGRHYEECVECGRYHRRAYMTETADGDYVCDDCRDKKYTQCTECKEWYLTEDILCTTDSEKCLCKDCAEEEIENAV